MNCKWNPDKHGGKPCPFHTITISNGKYMMKRKGKNYEEISEDIYNKMKLTHKQGSFNLNEEDLDDNEEIEEEEINRDNQIKSGKNLITNDKLPDGIKGEEFLGGTMDSNGKPIDMSKFKNGYLVSCGNASHPDNKKFLLESDFIDKFLENSDDEELYIGSWFENNKNTNEPTIWVENKEEAIKLAKLTGQYSITDCAAYNKYGCSNYKLLNEEQQSHADEIFISVCNDAEHDKLLSEVNI